jgi:hypothetical protein
MKVSSHLSNLKESINEIENAVKAGLEGKQRTLGFHASAACAGMLEIYLHRLGLLPEDNILKHEWLLSKNKLEQKLPFEFEGKAEILQLVGQVESQRNNFCYGKKKSFEELSSLVEDFNKVKKKFYKMGIRFDDEIEGEKNEKQK